MARLSTSNPEEAKRVLEALLFAADQPVAPGRLGQILGKAFDVRKVRALLKELNAEYEAQHRSFEIIEIAGGYQLHSRPGFKKWVGELHRHRRQERLSQSAVETLAIVAYKQPILRAQVDDIRGVQSGPLLRSLLERGLIKVVGRKNVPGRPILYGTTRRFLQHFGLKSLKGLPTHPELTPP